MARRSKTPSVKIHALAAFLTEGMLSLDPALRSHWLHDQSNAQEWAYETWKAEGFANEYDAQVASEILAADDFETWLPGEIKMLLREWTAPLAPEDRDRVVRGAIKGLAD